MRELYIYYRVRRADAAAARAEVLAMQNQLRAAQPGLVARLLTRSGTGEGPQTWMETYALPGAAQGVGPTLESLIESQAESWAHLIQETRHIEAFLSS